MFHLLIAVSCLLPPMILAESPSPPSQSATSTVLILHLVVPDNVVSDVLGNRYMSDPAGHRVLKIAPDSTVTIFGGPGLGPGQFSSPGMVILDRHQRLYVADRCNYRVQILDSGSGRWLGSIGKRGERGAKFNGLADMAFGPNDWLYVVDDRNDRVKVFDAQGKYRFDFGQPGPFHFGWFTKPYLGRLNTPHGIAIDSQTVYIADAGNHRIVTYSLDGHYIGSCHTPGDHDDRDLMPSRLTLLQDGNLQVEDLFSRRTRIIRLINVIAPQRQALSQRTK